MDFREDVAVWLMWVVELLMLSGGGWLDCR